MDKLNEEVTKQRHVIATIDYFKHASICRLAYDNGKEVYNMLDGNKYANNIASYLEDGTLDGDMTNINLLKDLKNNLKEYTIGLTTYSPSVVDEFSNLNWLSVALSYVEPTDTVSETFDDLITKLSTTKIADYHMTYDMKDRVDEISNISNKLK